METKIWKVIIENEFTEEANSYVASENSTIGTIDLLNSINESKLDSFGLIEMNSNKTPYSFTLYEYPLEYSSKEFSIDKILKQLAHIKDSEIIESINYEKNDEYCVTNIESQSKIFKFTYDIITKTWLFEEYLKKNNQFRNRGWNNPHKIYFTEQVGLKFLKFQNTNPSIQDKLMVKLFFLELYLESAKSAKLNPKTIPSYETKSYSYYFEEYSVIYLPSDIKSNNLGDKFIEVSLNYDPWPIEQNDNNYGGPIPNNDWMEGDESNYWNID